MSRADGQLTMVEFCDICGRPGVITQSVPTVETPTPHHACFAASARWLDRVPTPSPSSDARLRRRSRRGWRPSRADAPDLRVVS